MGRARAAGRLGDNNFAGIKMPSELSQVRQMLFAESPKPTRLIFEVDLVLA